MKKLIKQFSIILSVGLFFLGSTTAAVAENIGYVDMERIFNSYSETKKAKEKFDKQQEKLKEEFEKRQKKIEKAKEKGKSEEDLKKLVEKMDEELQPQRESLYMLNQQLQAKIRKDIKKAVASVAKEYGIDIVLSQKVRELEFVVHGGFDLTDFVIQKLD
tara:strand:- start:3719 stop:4198 length:480 start_codon:yes stop_codon:yes gene_type:complete